MHGMANCDARGFDGERGEKQNPCILTTVVRASVLVVVVVLLVVVLIVLGVGVIVVVVVVVVGYVLVVAIDREAVRTVRLSTAGDSRRVCPDDDDDDDDSCSKRERRKRIDTITNRHRPIKKTCDKACSFR
ncbi:uncharacterized protein TM35_000461720 [Trypanosoma theileri]|uniref:Uncharacterized protein n=1 Tax=Trypanosoma theileri TaxID=67003 RepID=A0A1X0NIQ6_9TRYP|nr:uncharacterized protein TM35_000461720 [Trypanosoma theileri]ORC84353.1 hypothetical protein TM35_000461720 [Trypanosoma theileri]